MSATSPKEIEEAIKRASETITKDTDIDKVIDAFAKLGIQVINSDGTFKCWYDIFEEMSEVWEKLNVDKE